MHRLDLQPSAETCSLALTCPFSEAASQGGCGVWRSCPEEHSRRERPVAFLERISPGLFSFLFFSFLFFSFLFFSLFFSFLLFSSLFFFLSFFLSFFLLSFFLKKRFYLFSFREMGREGEREGEKHVCVRDTLAGCLLHTPNWGPGPQPRYMS